ncbi:MAG: hypothetical protein ACO3C0_01105, partial [Burkholderiaceae bacterium]
MFNVVRFVMLGLIAIGLVACSGSSESTDPVIDRVTIQNIKYGQLGRFVIEGKHLDQEFSVSLSKCTGLA